MQKNFTYLITAVSRARTHRAVIATLLLFMLLLLAKSASAQGNKTPTVTGVTPTCATSGTAFTMQITGTNFVSSGQKSRVRINGTNGTELVGSAYVTVNSETSITVNVPSTAVVANNQGNLSIEVGNKSGNSYSYSKEQITVRVLSKPSISTSPVCRTSATQLVSVPMTITSSLSSGITYKWYDANGLLVHTSTSNPTLTYTPSLTETKTFYVATVITGGCESARTAVTATVLPYAVANANDDKTICSGGSTVLGTPAISGLTYEWSLVSGPTSTSGLYNANVAQPTVSHTTPGIYQYKVIAKSPGCAPIAEDLVNVNVSSAQTVKAVIDDLTEGAAYYTGATYSGPNNNITLTGVVNLPAGATATFSGPGVTSTTNNTATFSPCTALAANENEKIVTITYKITDPNACESVTSIQVSVIRSSYVVLNDAAPFPICRGVNTQYTAKVYRDADLVHVNNPRHPDHTQWLNTTKAYMRDEYYRYWEPVVLPHAKTGLTATQVEQLRVDANLFDYQWYENANAEKVNGVTVSHAGLSATDQFFVVATPKTNAFTCGINFTTAEVPILPKDRTSTEPGESNHLWISTPQTFNMALSTENRTICSNLQGDIKFTAEPDFGTGEFSGLEVSFYITSGGVKTFLLTDRTDPFEVTIPASSIKDGDVISIEYISTDIKCLISGAVGSSIIMTVNTPPAITSLNNSPSPLCPDQNASFSATVQATGTGLTYQWYKVGTTTALTNNTRISGATSATLTIANVTSTDAGFYYVIVSGSCSPSATSGNVELKVNPKPTATASAAQNQTTKCATGAATTFNLTGTVTNGTFTWAVTNNPNNLSVVITNGNGLNPTVTITGSGTVTISLTASSNQTPNCGTAVSNVVLTVNPLPITQTVTAPTYCASTSTGSTITLSMTQLGVRYALKQGNLVLATLDGNGTGPVAFNGKYPKGDYYVEGTTAAPANCPTNVGSVTVLETSSIENVIAELIVSPDPLQYFKDATFTANPKEKVRPNGTTIEWVYQWYIDYLVGGTQKLELTTNNVLSLTADKMNMNFIRVRVVQLAPENDPTCYSTLATEEINTDRNVVQPVELIYLKGDKKDNNVVALEWATAMEKNSEGFEVQVSQDAKNYRTLAFVASKAGGNTNQKQVYTFYDKENGKYGTRYYRLLQRDMNGDSEYFGPKAVKIGEAIESLSAYPNPFSSEVNLEFNAEEAGTMQVLVADAAGAKILERTLPAAKGNNRTSLQLSSRLPQGMYIITTRLNGKTNHIKLLKR